MTLRFTSPQAAIVSRSTALISWIVFLSTFLRTPWNWKACRVVSFSVPLAYSSAKRSICSHCSGVATPPATRTRIMKL